MVSVKAYILTPLAVAATAALGAYGLDRGLMESGTRKQITLPPLVEKPQEVPFRPVTESKTDRLSVVAKPVASVVVKPEAAPELPAFLTEKPMPDTADIVGSISGKPGVSAPAPQITSLAPQIPPVPVPQGKPAMTTAISLPVAPLPQPRPAEIASLNPAGLIPPAAKTAEPPAATAPALTQPAAPVQTTGTLNARLTAKGFALGDATFIRIFKDEAKLEVWMSKGNTYSLFESFPICKFSGGYGPKQMQGDYQSPEGFYMVGRRQLNPNSAYHLAFNLGYPNAYDKAHGRSGSALMVHGDCKSVGCFAMTNKGIEQIYAIVEAALNKQAEVPVHIFPFRPTKGALFKQMFNPWRGFWANLAEGYEAFEQTKRPPVVGVCNRQYVFGDQASNCQRIAAW